MDQQSDNKSSSVGLRFEANDEEDLKSGSISYPNTTSNRIKAEDKLISTEELNPAEDNNLLERAIEAENVLEMRTRKRIKSHFVDSKNDDMLLEEIQPDD